LKKGHILCTKTREFGAALAMTRTTIEWFLSISVDALTPVPMAAIEKLLAAGVRSRNFPIEAMGSLENPCHISSSTGRADARQLAPRLAAGSDPWWLIHVRRYAAFQLEWDNG
jgi:hypothetical protein